MSMPDFKFDTQTRYPAVTKEEYRRRAALAVDASQFKADGLLAMFEALGRGQSIDVAVVKLGASRQATVAEYNRIRAAVTRRDYIPQVAQVEILAELRSRVTP